MIRFENVTKAFEAKKVLDDVSFEVKRGEILAVVGPSGTGKSVTLKHMVKLLTPDAGRIWLDDIEVSAATGKRLEEVRRKFGYLFQGGALLGWLTVAENVALPLQERTKLSDEEIARRVEDALKAVELTDAANLLPAEISGGMLKRAGLARAVACECNIVLYDEPTSGLDPVTSVTINNLICRLNKERSLTSIVVTHDLQGALTFADRIMMLSGGKVRALCSPAEFVHSADPVVHDFLAAQFITPEWFSAEVERKH